jgi:hypothetical protein
VLTAGISTTGLGGALLSLPIKLATEQRFLTDSAILFSHEQTIDLLGHTLTLAGSGNFAFANHFIDTSSTGGAQILYTGTGRAEISGDGADTPVRIVANTGVLQFGDASFGGTDVALNGGQLTGSGRIGALTSTGGVLEGTLTIGSVQFVVNGDLTLDKTTTFDARLPSPLL